MNRKGNPGTLVASHPGNRNAVQHGAYSQRLIQERAAEIEAELKEGQGFSAIDCLAVEEAARWKATLEAIDRDIGERGLMKKGQPHPLLGYQLRASRRYDSALAAIAIAVRRGAEQQAEPAAPAAGEPAESGVEGEAGQQPINITAALESEIRASKPSAVRVSALVALDRIRRQPPIEDDDVPGRVVQVFD